MLAFRESSTGVRHFFHSDPPSRAFRAFFPNTETGVKSSRSPARIIFTLALVYGLFQIVFPTGFGFGSGWETVAIARELARTGVYGNPFHAGASGATAVIAPLFPLYLAGLIKLLGDTPAFALAASLAAVLALALHAALLPRLSLMLFGDSRAGILAGLLSVPAFRLMPQWDAAFTACGILLFLLKASPATWRSIALSGGAAGLLLLANPATILITGPWVIYLCQQRRLSLFRSAAFGAAVFLTALPWMIRNESMLGTFSVKDNLGMTIYASNNNCASSSLQASIASACYDAAHPNLSVHELRVLNEIGEVPYDHARTSDAVLWIRTHPGVFARLTTERILNFWFPRSAIPRYPDLVIQVVTCLSVPGLLLLVCRGIPVSWYMIAVAVIHPLLYYVVVSDVRYRYSLLWLSLLCAGYFLNAVLKWLLPVTDTRMTGDSPPALEQSDTELPHFAFIVSNPSRTRAV